MHYATNPSAVLDPFSAANLTIVSDRGGGCMRLTHFSELVVSREIIT